MLLFVGGGLASALWLRSPDVEATDDGVPQRVSEHMRQQLLAGDGDVRVRMYPNEAVGPLTTD